MHRWFRTRSRLIAPGILLAFVASWVLPAEACAASVTPAAQMGCPDCASAPCCDPDHCCCGTMASACAATMLPAVSVPAPSPAKAVPAPALHQDFSRSLSARSTALGWAAHPPFYPPSTSHNIRYCTFQE